MNKLETRRRDLVAAPLLAMAAMALRGQPSNAAGVDPAMTMVTLPDADPLEAALQLPSRHGQIRQHVQ